MVIFKVISVVFAAYLMGCFVTGYYLVRWRTGKDLRTLGSGSLGARNAGRLLGSGGYFTTGLLDFAKGVAAILLARWAGLNDWALGVAALAVVAGHNWPAQLGFHGGKGIATGYGAVLALAPWVAGAMWGVFLPITLLLRSSTLGGVAAFLAAPLLAMAFSARLPVVVTFALLGMIVAFTHRRNVRDELVKRPASSPVSTEASARSAASPNASARPLP